MKIAANKIAENLECSAGTPSETEVGAIRKSGNLDMKKLSMNP